MAVLRAAASASLVVVSVCLAAPAISDPPVLKVAHFTEAEFLRRAIASETAALIERPELVRWCDDDSYVEIVEQAALSAQIARLTERLKGTKAAATSQ
jgi:hypothetical protein